MRIDRTRRGQSVVEYMVIVSVLVIALVEVGVILKTVMSEGFDEMLTDTETVLNAPASSGSNDKR